MTAIRRAGFSMCILVAAAAFGAPSAGAQTVVDRSLNGQGSTVEVGETFQIVLAPPNSGSTGYRWRFAKRPNRSVLRLTSSRSTGDPRRQVFTFRARKAGVTSLRLQYVSPGRRRQIARRFRHTIVVNAPVPQLDCSGVQLSGRRALRNISVIAESGDARVFRTRRTIRVFSAAAAGVVRRSYDVFLGCAFAEGRTHELGALSAATGQIGAPAAGANQLFNVTLRGTVAGYAYDMACPVETRENTNCTSEPGPVLAASDLNGGRLIRVIFPETSGPDDPNRVTGLVVSPTGGLAWMEVGHVGADPFNLVRRSDAPAEPGESVADEAETLDSGADVDPDSLYFDGTNVEWRKDGRVQRARLR